MTLRRRDAQRVSKDAKFQSNPEWLAAALSFLICTSIGVCKRTGTQVNGSSNPVCRSTAAIALTMAGCRRDPIPSLRGHYPASSLQRNGLSAAARFRRRGNDLRVFHSLWVGKAGGELLQSSPPLDGASVLSASRFELLVPFLFDRRLGSHVPYKSLVELRAAYMPDAAWSVSGHPPS